MLLNIHSSWKDKEMIINQGLSWTRTSGKIPRLTEISANSPIWQTLIVLLFHLVLVDGLFIFTLGSVTVRAEGMSTLWGHICRLQLLDLRHNVLLSTLRGFWPAVFLFVLPWHIWACPCWAKVEGTRPGMISKGHSLQVGFQVISGHDTWAKPGWGLDSFGQSSYGHPRHVNLPTPTISPRKPTSKWTQQTIHWELGPVWSLGPGCSVRSLNRDRGG